MQLLGADRSLAGWIDRFASVVWVLTWILFFHVMASSLFGLGSLLFDGGTSASTPIPVRFDGVPAGEMPIDSDPLAVDSRATLSLDSGFVSVRPANAFLWAWGTANGGAVFALYLWLLHNLKSLTRALREGRPFDARNSKRVRTIGIAVCGLWLIHLVGQVTAQQYARRFFVVDPNPVASIGDLSLDALFVGLLIVVIGEVFRMGTALQESADVTV